MAARFDSRQRQRRTPNSAKSAAGKNAKHGAGKKPAAKAPAKKQHGHKDQKIGKKHAKR